MKKIITFLYLLILAYACYDDKGNYDYAPANNLKIKGIPTDTAVQSYEVLKLVPEFERSLLPSEEGLVYSWTIDGFVVYSRDFGGNAAFGFEPVYLYVGSQPEGCGDDERSECIC